MARTKGSVTRCGHCYEVGHNKRTCPHLKKEIENNPGGYYDRQAQRRKARAKKRECSYCGETGHNMRTCQKAKEDRIRYSVVNWEYQQAMGTSMDQMGLGVGSIITREAWGEVSYWLITKINWDRINIANWYQCGTGNENCEGSAYLFEAQRVDTASLSEYDRGKSYNLNRSFRALRSIYDNHNLPVAYSAEQDIQVIGPIAVQGGSHLLMDRNAGLDFMRHADYKGRAMSMIKRIEKKWNSRHDQ